MPAPTGSIASLSTSPMLTQYAITQSQKAIRKIGSFIAPQVQVPSLTFRYRTYNDKNRYKIADTQRNPGDKATRLGFTSTDSTAQIIPNALDFPVPNAEGLSDLELGFAIMEAQDILADASAIALEYQQMSLALAALTPTSVSWSSSSFDPISDATNGLDQIIKRIKLSVGNGANVKVLFGTSAALTFRNQALVRSRYIVAAGNKGSAVGTISPQVEDFSGLLFTAPEVQVSEMVVDLTAPGVAPSPSFLFDNQVLIFASNSTPNRMDPSFMKTFTPMGGFFKPGSYMTEDNRDQVLKMDWSTLPLVTNPTAGVLLTIA